MNLGRLCQIILKSYKEISGYGQSAQHVIFAYHIARQTPLIALPPLRFPAVDCKLFLMMPYVIILKVRKFHQPTANRFSTARQKPVSGHLSN